MDHTPPHQNLVERHNVSEVKVDPTCTYQAHPPPGIGQKKTWPVILELIANCVISIFNFVSYYLLLECAVIFFTWDIVALGLHFLVRAIHWCLTGTPLPTWPLPGPLKTP